MNKRSLKLKWLAVGLGLFLAGVYFGTGEEAELPVDPHAGHRMMASAPREVQLSPRAQALAELELAKVERRELQAELRLFGSIAYDETKLAHITAWVPGRVERLFLNFTGTQVAKGEHMAEIYSPELISAQEELQQAAAAQANLTEGSSPFIREQAQRNLKAARSKLQLLGIGEEQIREIEQGQDPHHTLTLQAPISGVLIEKKVLEGQYVQVGTRIYSLADLSELFLELEAYESDLAWLRFGQELEFTTAALPGERFQGRISFIDPFLNEKTRSARVRVHVPNEEGKLKPGLYVQAQIRPSIGPGGKVRAPSFKGKWISPMHPHIICDEPGTCPICGMPLVKAESLDFVDTEAPNGELPLSIPETAVLLTGKRAIVYVQTKGKAGSYEAREVVLGPRAKDRYIVVEGLKEGELVVTHGNFKIDSEAQIQAKPSMMMPEGGGKAMQGHQHHGH